ncbi:Actin-binding protein IPP [Tetrabaena socialis]|uniref:Actin-binding protein IPP n=1 Tax=Tetrabaena socialis TaxID=47790 RepID=A0A2J7ZS99_9CHLO|nr:Actin-binding protein IPP [Tetrabaena socialis]|eukprot:PNH03151.1 Actin-binding protein IPP [Tetrabaena socialis]
MDATVNVPACTLVFPGGLPRRPDGEDGLCRGLVSRPLIGNPGDAGSVTSQTLLALGADLRVLLGADSHSGLELGARLQIYEDINVGMRRPYMPACGFISPCWDPYSASVYAIVGRAIVRISSDDVATVLAGDPNDYPVPGGADGEPVDGLGLAARFKSPVCLASDGTGSLYVGDQEDIRRVQLPPPHQAAGQPGEALVTTLLGGRARDAVLGSLAFDAVSNSLFYNMPCYGDLQRLPLGEPNAEPVTIVTNPPYYCAGDGVAVDGGGKLYAALHSGRREEVRGAEQNATTVWRFEEGDAVKTEVAKLQGRWNALAVLPNGYLALLDRNDETLLQLLDLGLQPPRLLAAPLPQAARSLAAPHRSLPGDFGMLLDRQPDDTTDITLEVGGITFHGHRLILSSRCDFFSVDKGFDFSSTKCISLPDMDPIIFKLAFRFMYTGIAEIPVEQARAVAELADRLLLPELGLLAQEVVMAGVAASNVVGLLLWAEAMDGHSPAFTELLARLKAWYVEHYKEVHEEVPNVVEQLAAASPKLVAELTAGCLMRAERPRYLH